MSSLFSNIWGILMVVVFFGGSIFIHELGHFLAAKWRGLHIERFSIGFGPKIVAWKRKGVEYRLSWLPLGGYVALPQLADMRGIEGDSSVDMKQLPPIGYLDKVIVAVAGAVFNIIFAFAIATLLFFTGRPSTADRASTEIGHVSEFLLDIEGNSVPAPAFEAGLRAGDRVISIDQKPIRNWDNIHQAIALSFGTDESGNRAIDFEVDRNGEVLHLTINPIISKRYETRQIGIGAGFTNYIGYVYPNSPADSAGIKAGDALLSVDGIPIRHPQTFRDYLNGKEGQAVTLQLSRAIGDITKETSNAERELYTADVVPVLIQISKNGQKDEMVGFYRSLVPAADLIKQTPWEQIIDVGKMTQTTLTALVHKDSDIKLKQMSGPVDIARVIFNLSQYDTLNMLWFVLLVNVSLAIFNLLPIPVLDGGHIAFATISKILNRPISPNLIASAQGSFMVLLFGAMIYITYHNVTRWAGDAAEVAEAQDEYIAPVFGQESGDAENAKSEP